MVADMCRDEWIKNLAHEDLFFEEVVAGIAGEGCARVVPCFAINRHEHIICQPEPLSVLRVYFDFADQVLIVPLHSHCFPLFL